MYPQPYQPAVQVERMEDLPLHPRHICRVCSPGSGEGICDRHARTLKRQRSANAPRQKSVPQTQTHAPQLSTTQRRRNQAGQPRETDGTYAEKKPGSRWKHFLSAEPAPRTSLKRIKKQPVQAKTLRSTRKRPVPMSAVEHRNPLVKIHWWVTRGFRQWRRKKVRQLRQAFSLRG